MADKRKLDRSADTDRGSVVNPGSEDDENLTRPRTDDADSAGHEAEQSGTSGARGKPAETVVVPPRK